MDDDQTYYANRAEEQRRAAAHARSDEARRLHLELAALLAARLETTARPNSGTAPAHP